MKILLRHAIPLVFLLLSVLNAPSEAQSITTEPLSEKGFCGGESVSINFTVTGNFQDGNSFIAQLSDPNGSFSSGFQNIGSTQGTSSGTVLGAIPKKPATGDHYRIRIIGSNPSVSGSDNGSDLIIGLHPKAGFTASHTVISVGDAVTYTDLSTGASSVLWDFGDGASPASSTSRIPPPVTYSTIGLKTVSLTATSISGCSTTMKGNGVVVYSCNPQIPADAQIDSGKGDFSTGNGYVWLQPGITFITSTGEYTVFAEPGSSVNASGAFMGLLTVYLKAGASYTGEHGPNIIIYDPGAGLHATKGDTLIECASLQFDYSHAPHSRFVNAVTPPGSEHVATSLYPNPVSKMLFVEAGSAPREVILYDELGNTVIDEKENLTAKLEIGTASFPSGTYILKLIYNDRIETNKILIVH